MGDEDGEEPGFNFDEFEERLIGRLLYDLPADGIPAALLDEAQEQDAGDSPAA